jgi:hypothetical protein
MSINARPSGPTQQLAFDFTAAAPAKATSTPSCDKLTQRIRVQTGLSNSLSRSITAIIRDQSRVD